MTTTWTVDAGAAQIPIDATLRGESTFTVTNTGVVDDTVRFDAVPGPGADKSWFSVEQPQRLVPGQNGTVVFLVRVAIPPGTPPGQYDLTGRVYSTNTDTAPEDTMRSSGRVTFVVPATVVPPKRRWVPYAIAAVVLAVVLSTVAFLVLRPDSSEDTATPGPSRSPGGSPAPTTRFAETLGAVATGGGRATYFVRSAAGDLWQFTADGGAGTWTNVKHPDGRPITAGVGVIALDGGSRARAYVLAGEHVWAGEGLGSSWSWSDLGGPDGVPIAGPVGALAEPGNIASVFVRGRDEHLYQRRTAGWGDLGQPGSTTIASAGSVFSNEGGANTHIFVIGADGTLRHPFFAGKWRWEGLGAPPGTRVELLLGGTAQGDRLPHEFVRASDGNVWVRRWNGTSWNWQLQGRPPTAGATIGGALGALPGPGDDLLLFVQTGQNQVWLNRWDAQTQSWRWIDQKISGSGPLATDGGAVTSTAPNQVVLFARSATGDVWFTRPFAPATTTPQWHHTPAP
ncbi:hypothetical protein [Cryptosporangium phraense]|uniref:Uncharacterized protein n=1 Tax=Cryptosporangium phraense TaxID=2593070 RepID=A0A545APW8_9ACTN|nr:hypothetical protein [Cryptosporangium phraense]TQS43378.1 hypothetical protein FL583_19285 [Cryptosporangium phraense]